MTSSERVPGRVGGGSIPSTSNSSEETAIGAQMPEKIGTNDLRQRNKPPRSNTNASTIQRAMTNLQEHMKPERKIGKEPTYKQSFMAILKASWLNVLLLCVPVSFALHFVNVNGIATFLVSFFAIIPLAKLLGFATEEIALRVGPVIGGLINATLGNVVELLVAILALVKCEIVIVQSSLLGSILSNLLLVLGCSFMAGGIRFSEVGFSNASAQTNSSLLVISVIMILIPAGFHATFGDTLGPNTERDDILKMSRGVSILVLLIYVAYLVFQLFTHPHLYDENGNKLPPEEGMRGIGSHRMFKIAKSAGGTNVARQRIIEAHKEEQAEMEHEEEEQPTLNLISTIVLLVAVTVIVGFVAEWLVDSINDVTATGNISATWVGLILLPIVGNAAEHVTSIMVAYKDKLDLAIGVAVGSSIQVALFLIPVLVLLGWCLDKPMSLLFDPFLSIVLFLAVLIVNYTTQDSRANWLEGFILVFVYIIVAVVFFFIPGSDETSNLLQCN